MNRASLFKISTLCLAVLIAGCSGGGKETRELGENDDVVNTSPPEVHHHHDEGPHGGHILEFGEYHGEITYADGTVTVYVLGDDAETAVPLEQAGATLMLIASEGAEATEIQLAATPQEGEAEGSTSRFVSPEGSIPEEIDDIEKIKGRVFLTVGETRLTAELEHEERHQH